MTKGRWKQVGIWLWVGSLGVGWSLLASPPSRRPMWVLSVQYTKAVDGKASASPVLTLLLQTQVKRSSTHRLVAIPAAFSELAKFTNQNLQSLNALMEKASERPEQLLFVRVMRLGQEFHLQGEVYRLEQNQWKLEKEELLTKQGEEGGLSAWLGELWLTLFPPPTPPPPPPPPTPKAGDRQTFEVKGVAFAMRYIPAGSFAMGSPQDEKGRDYDEGPQRQVRLTRGFWMLETEVTQEQFRLFRSSYTPSFGGCGGRCPAENMSWQDAAAFANWLSEQQGFKERCFTCKEDETCDIPDKATYLACRGWRLPTEAEWEYAARAGTTTRFHTGDCITPDQANFKGKHPPEGCPSGAHRKTPTVVGRFSPNAWGLHDMHGNVWEWVADRYKFSYNSNDLENPLQLPESNPSKLSPRVRRGGSWDDDGGKLRSAFRRFYTPADRFNYVGFRLLRSL